MKVKQGLTRLEKSSESNALIIQMNSEFGDGVIYRQVAKIEIDKNAGVTTIVVDEDEENIPICVGCDKPIINKKKMKEDDNGDFYHEGCLPEEEEESVKDDA